MTDRVPSSVAALLAVAIAGTVLLVVPGSADAASGVGVPPASGGNPVATERVLEVQRRLQESRAAHERAASRLLALREHRTARVRQATSAARTASRAAEQVDSSSSGLWGAVDRLTGGADELDRAQASMETAQHLQQLATIADRGLAEARGDVREAARARRAAEVAASQVEQSAAARASARLARQWAQLPTGYEAGDPGQDRRNRAALSAWHDHLARMGAAGIVPPAPEDLTGPRLPAGVRPAVDDTGRQVPGVGLARARSGTTFQVLPDVTVRAVSAAFAGLGKVSDPGSCATFVGQVWDIAQVDVPSDGVGQWESLAAVPERQVVVGDVVFFERPEGYGVGLAVSAGSVIALDPVEEEVAVERVSAADVLAVRRVPLAPDRGERVAAVPEQVLDGCEPPAPEPVLQPGDGTVGAVVPVVVGGWTHPLADGTYTLSSSFGVSGPLWSSGQHTGQDFAAPLGTPVVAAAAGRVWVESSSWAGQLVRIDHGDGVETRYAHMSRVDVSSGDIVEAGHQVGAVGSEGNSTGPHLHFEVWVDGTAVDPMPYVAGTPP